MLESALETFLHKRIRLVGGTTFKLMSTVRGMPDRLVVLPGGKMYLIEMKTPTGEVSPIQRERHQKLADLGVHVYVLNNREAVLSWIRRRFPS